VDEFSPWDFKYIIVKVIPVRRGAREEKNKEFSVNLCLWLRSVLSHIVDEASRQSGAESEPTETADWKWGRRNGA